MALDPFLQAGEDAYVIGELLRDGPRSSSGARRHHGVGRMPAATGRSPMRASHLHFMVEAPGCRTVVTHIFVRGGELLDSDTVFGVKESLVKDFERRPAGTPTPDGRAVDGIWTQVRFDIVLAPRRRPGMTRVRGRVPHAADDHGRARDQHLGGAGVFPL